LNLTQVDKTPQPGINYRVDKPTPVSSTTVSQIFASRLIYSLFSLEIRPLDLLYRHRDLNITVVYAKLDASWI